MVLWGSGGWLWGYGSSCPSEDGGNETCAPETRKNPHEMSAALAGPGEAALSRPPRWAGCLRGPAGSPAPLAAPAF